ncbi:MAG: dynamin family protein [Bryobacterales bacterium]|nr:dynamin family protein [Bryobacterales bacterium]
MAKRLSAGEPREHRSLDDALDATLTALRDARQRVAGTRADLEGVLANAKALARLATRLLDRIGVIDKTVSTAPTPVSAARMLEEGPEGLQQVRIQVRDSEQQIERLMVEAGRFPRLRALVNGLRSLLPGGTDSDLEDLDSARRALARGAVAVLEQTDVLAERLRQTTVDRERLASAVAVTRSAVAEARRQRLPTSERTIVQKCEAADGELRSAASNIDRSELAVRALAGQARRYRDDISLVGSIMSAETHVDEDIEQAFRDFGVLLSRYMDESQHDDFPAEAEAYDDLLNVQSRMARVRFAPRLAGKNIVAVAGGFSSGKSSFINSLIGPESRLLPTQTTPTTSIPTYVHYEPDTQLEIACFNNDGGRHEVDEPTLRNITHGFKDSYGIPLKKIVDRIVVSTPDMADWGRIAFVDTPGYTNPEGKREQRRDVDLTLGEVLSAHYLVWMVDCERGTLLDTDVQYIKRFLARQGGTGQARKGDKEVYIVVNKADKIPSSRRFEVLGQMSNVAENAGIPTVGLGMYSAHQSVWFDVSGETFVEFLNGVNAREPDLGIKADVEAVLGRYTEYHRHSAEQSRSEVGLFKRLGLVVDEGSRGRSRLSEDLVAAGSAAEREAVRHEEHATRYDSLRGQFGECLERFSMPLGNCHSGRRSAGARSAATGTKPPH